MAKNFAHTVLFGPTKYQGIGVKNPYFLQETIHIIAFLNEAAYNSSTGELLQSNADFFWSKWTFHFLSPPPLSMILYGFLYAFWMVQDTVNIYVKSLFKLEITKD